MNRYFTSLLMLFLVVTASKAAFTATGGTGNAPYVVTPPASTGLEHVFVSNGSQGLTLRYETDQPTAWTWYSYDKDPDAATPVDPALISTTGQYTQLGTVNTDAGYFVSNATGERHYTYVVAWKPVGYRSLTVQSEGSACTEVVLQALADGGDQVYYTVSGLRRVLEREHRLTWTTETWQDATENYVSQPQSASFTTMGVNWSVNAPLCDTEFHLTGDQYGRWFEAEETLVLPTYKALAVKANAKATVDLRDVPNENGTSTGDLTGSAPLTVTFSSHPSAAVNLVEWLIYKPGKTTSYARFTDEELTYTFKESGQYTVKLYVSNNQCMDSAEFTPQVYESMLDCPNFFTPRSSPGDNDEFRVAYKSIVSFKGVIVNRWGNVLFQWSDPAIGWNGTYKGKAVSPGVYYYMIEAKGADGIVYKKSGDINLLE
ncbi:MAG: hypothetical protein BWY72_01890 [Bacteroidetes bacterium ADurb.Bin416]|nr:MAG: hypothetical protein BWY72_01890 [Bacteroidetes bacterium ADurb.Bin416]